MSEMIDIETIYRQERKRWLKEEARHQSVSDRLIGSVPYWIILVALVLYGLSAPHTASVFEKLTPNWGWIAPIGVEFGLLYAAFRRRLAKAQQETLSWTLSALEILLFLTAMLVNGAGSFTSVVSVTQIENLSFKAIVEQFGQLPATSQSALIMAALSAFIIPIGALVAGDGLAALALEQRDGGDYKERQWKDVEYKILYQSIFVRYLRQELPEREARQRAMTEVKGYLAASNPSAVRMLSASNGQNEQNGHQADKQQNSVKGKVRTYLDSNPELVKQSVNQVVSAFQQAGLQAGRTTIAEVLQERKQNVKI